MNLNRRLAAKLREERVSQGLTQREVAQACIMPDSMIVAIEHLECPSLECHEYADICKALKLDAGDILNDALKALRRA